MVQFTVLLVAAVLSGAAVRGGDASAPAARWRPLGATPGFPGLARTLRSLVEARQGSVAATFCVVLRDDGDGDPVLYALWPRARRLYRWTATRDPQLGDDTLVNHAPLDLRRDVARTPADRLSTYKVSRAWIADVAAQCRDHGEPVRVAGSAR